MAGDPTARPQVRKGFDTPPAPGSSNRAENRPAKPPLLYTEGQYGKSRASAPSPVLYRGSGGNY